MNYNPSSSPQPHSTLSSHASRRADLIDPVQRDLHFPLFCTPYYGFVPDDMTDFHIELFQLACHLVRATPPLLDVWDGNTLPSPSSLLATLAALFPERITTVPGEGVFLRPYSDPDGENPPQSCWAQLCTGTNSLCSSPLPPLGIYTHGTLLEFPTPHVFLSHSTWSISLRLPEPWSTPSSPPCPSR